MASVFVVRVQDLGFLPPADGPYETKIRDCEVKTWARGDVVYVMVI